MYARDLMTPEPVRLRADSTLAEALGLLALADVRHLPVVEGGEVVGMLSERDVLGVVAPSEDGAAPAGLDRKVRDLMSDRVYALGPEASVRHVIDEMLAHRIGAVVVIEDGQLLGIISYVDVLQALKGLVPD